MSELPPQLREALDIMGRRGKVVELTAPATRTPCDQPNPCEDGELCATHEEEQAHAEGEHAFCGPTCEVEFPTELLRNSILAKGYPGTAGILDELLRRAAAAQPADDRATVLLEAANTLERRFGVTPVTVELRLMSAKAQQSGGRTSEEAASNV